MKKLDQNRTPLFDALKAYLDRRVISFDVPGHKHGVGLPELADYIGLRTLEMDVNAMECLDNICNPIGVIKEAEELAASAYGGDHAYFLVWNHLWSAGHDHVYCNPGIDPSTPECP